MTEAAYEHNGRHITREAFYAIACDPRRSVAVEACAGAGKTWMLVSRILRALLAGCAPHEILAISFTRRAAGEMRERLRNWLAEFAEGEQKPEALLAELRARGLGEAAAQAAVEPLRGLYAQVLQAARGVQIRTFHGWFWSLLASAPLVLLERLGLPANAELIEDEAELIAKLWPRFYALLLELPQERADYQALITRHGRFQTQKALDAVLRRRIENWPPAQHGDGVVRPAELSSIARNGEGLVVESVSWWGSAPALDHQMGLALDIAHRLTAQR